MDGTSLKPASFFLLCMNEQNGIPFLIHQDYITPLNRPVTSITGKIITIDDFPPKSNPKSLRSIFNAVQCRRGPVAERLVRN